jgi:hypothetical protein
MHKLKEIGQIIATQSNVANRFSAVGCLEIDFEIGSSLQFTGGIKTDRTHFSFQRARGYSATFPREAHMLYQARLSFYRFVEAAQTTDTAPIILLSSLALLLLMVAGTILYLYLSGALHALHMRPFRLALYVLLLVTAMSAGIKLLQQSSADHEAAVDRKNNIRHVGSTRPKNLCAINL